MSAKILPTATIPTQLSKFKDEWIVRAISRIPGITPEQIHKLRQEGHPLLSRALIEKGLVTAQGLAAAIEARLRIPTEHPVADAVDKLALSLVPEKICRRYEVFPLRLQDDNIHVAMANPLDMEAIADLQVITGRTVRPVFTFPNEINACFDRAFSQNAVIYDLLEKIGAADEVEVLDEGVAAAPAEIEDIQSPVIKLVDSLLSQAVRLKASDIHIEHEELKSLVRFRIDGNLKNMMNLPHDVGSGPIVSRIKIMSNMDPSIHMRPQDGRTKIRVGTREIGLRVSVLPTAHGEKVVLRVLDKLVAQVPFEKLGFAPEVSRELARCAATDHGIVLVTGPTGSGKTTTLYSILDKCRHEATNIVTVEDPIEYKLDGINQVQINEKQGLGFATVLRSVLRQDPDVIMVGEIRDQETADIALQASMTGHLVFSTLHTNDTLSTISRLVDMGVARFKISPGLLAVTAQRLVRRLCRSCREPVPENAISKHAAAAMRDFGLPVRAWKARGCKACGEAGYSGRVSVVELLVVDRRIKNLINSGALEADIRQAALDTGKLRLMSMDALWQLSEGNTDESEILPFLHLHHRDAPVATPPSPSAPQVQGRGKRTILVADDNDIVRLLTRTTLEGQGYDVAEARDGEEALAFIAAGAPDLLLLDLRMPKLDGFAVIKGVREILGLTGLPIVMLTAEQDDKSQELALSLGADDYINKPFKPGIVTARINAVFRRLGRTSAS